MIKILLLKILKKVIILQKKKKKILKDNVQKTGDINWENDELSIWGNSVIK